MKKAERTLIKKISDFVNDEFMFDFVTKCHEHHLNVFFLFEGENSAGCEFNDFLAAAKNFFQENKSLVKKSFFLLIFVLRTLVSLKFYFN